MRHLGVLLIFLFLLVGCGNMKFFQYDGPTLTEQQFESLFRANQDFVYVLPIMDIMYPYTDQTIEYAGIDGDTYQDYYQTIHDAEELYEDLHALREIYQLDEDMLDVAGGEYVAWYDIYKHNQNDLDILYQYYVDGVRDGGMQHKGTTLHELIHMMGAGHEPEYDATREEFILRDSLTGYDVSGSERLTLIHQDQDLSYMVSDGLYFIALKLYTEIMMEFNWDLQTTYSECVAKASEQYYSDDITWIENLYGSQIEELEFYDITLPELTAIYEEICEYKFGGNNE